MAFKRKYRSSRRSKRSRRGKYSRTRRSFQTRVKKVLMKTAETKYQDLSVENQQLYHNLGYGTSLLPPTTVTSIPFLYNPWLNITQGTGRQQRIGDKIQPRGMSLKVYLANKLDRPHTKIRLIVAILPKEVNGTVSSSTFNPFQSASLGSDVQNHLKPADHDAGVKFLYDRIHTIDHNSWFSTPANGKEVTKYIKIWIKRKKAGTIVFSNNGVAIVNKPVAIYAIPYEQFSTLTTDNVSTFGCYLRMYYKDI